MGRFMQYLPGLCLCCVITSRVRLRPHLSGQGPTQDPEIWVLTKPAALCCCQEMWQAWIPQHPAWNATRCWEAALQDGASRMWFPLTTLLKTTLVSHLAHRSPRFGVFFGLLECKEQPLTPACRASHAMWVHQGCRHTHTTGALSGITAPEEMMLQPLQPETSPTQDATTWLSQQDHTGGPCCIPWHSRWAHKILGLMRN